MRIKNAHTRIIRGTKEQVWEQFEKLSSKEDRIWPNNQWPSIRFDCGLSKGSHGGHGPIRYTIIRKSYEDFMTFKFTNPKGFDGIHEFRVVSLGDSEVEVSHIIEMATSGWATYYWLFVVRWLHDALIEDAFDNLENLFSETRKKTGYGIWVKSLRLLKSKQRRYNKKLLTIEKR